MNKLNMILFIIMRVIAINKNFFIVYSFAKSKVIVLFNFLFDSFRYFVFDDDIAEAQLILAN